MSTITHAPVAFLGATTRILARGEETDGAIGVVEMIEGAGKMPPLHVHHTHDESFYILEGAITVFLPGREVPLEAGELAFAPRGIPHAYRVGEEPARVLVTSTPAGFEQFVAAVAAEGASDPARLAEIAADHDIEILGPPGMLP